MFANTCERHFVCNKFIVKMSLVRVDEFQKSKIRMVRMEDKFNRLIP